MSRKAPAQRPTAALFTTDAGRPLAIRVYIGPPCAAYCVECGAREDFTSPDLRLVLDGTWQVFCDVCRERYPLGRLLRHGVRWLSIDLIREQGWTEAEWTARGGEPYIWAVADGLNQAAQRAAAAPAPEEAP
jgi:hypothetical protein